MINDWKELLSAVLDSITKKTRFHRTYRYQVYSNDTGDATSTLKRVDSLADTPDTITVQKHYGCGGLSCVLRAAALVDVAFEGGDPGRPYVVAYYPVTDGNDSDPALPKQVTIDAKDLIQIGKTSGHAGLEVHVGENSLLGVARLTDNVNCGSLSFVAVPPSGAFPAGGTQILYIGPTGVPMVFGTLPVPITPDPSTGGTVPIFGRVNTASSILKTQ